MKERGEIEIRKWDEKMINIYIKDEVKMATCQSLGEEVI
jgi:hypothetical protein